MSEGLCLGALCFDLVCPQVSLRSPLTFYWRSCECCSQVWMILMFSRLTTDGSTYRIITPTMNYSMWIEGGAECVSFKWKWKWKILLIYVMDLERILLCSTSIKYIRAFWHCLPASEEILFFNKYNALIYTHGFY